MFAVVVGRPGVLFPTMMLSQHNTSSAECHYAAVKRVFRCLCSTIDNGLHLWKPAADHKLPAAPFHALHKDTNNTKMPDYSQFDPTSFACADWAANLRTRRSVSGTAVFLAGVPMSCK